jgi:hypothetical protein
VAVYPTRRVASTRSRCQADNDAAHA